MEISLEQNTSHALALNGAHQDRRIVVLGSGPQLGRLGDDVLSWLADQVTIGVNRTFYVHEPTYFLSAYPSEVMLALSACDDTTALHIRPRYEPPLFHQTICLRRADFVSGTRLPERLEAPVPTVLTFRNVALAATHLAALMGAEEVVYLGIEQQDGRHYYDLDEDLRARIRDDLAALADHEDLFVLDHPHATMELLQSNLRRPVDELAAVPFYELDHTPSFAEYFDQLTDRGMRVTSAVRDSVITAAGGTYRSLSDLIRT